MTETRVPRRPSAGRATDQNGVVPEADMRPGVSSAVASAKPWLPTGMRWPAISDPGAPDRPGAKFRQSFGAVPVVLRLGYPATV